MKRLLWLALLLPLGAHAQQIAFCNLSTVAACNTSSNPGTGTSGDASWLAFGKFNANFATLKTEGLFASSGSSTAGILLPAYGGTGTATPGLVAGTNITITGTWPNQTINSSGGGSMTWPSAAGIPNYSGSSSWGMSYSATNTIPANFVSTLNQNTTGTAGNITATSNSTLATLTALTSANGSTIPNTAGTLAGSIGTFTLNDCVKVGQASPLVLADAGACGGGSGTVNAAAQFSLSYYSAAGSATTLSGLASPTSGAGIYALHYDPTSTTAVAPTADQVGAHTRSLNGAATIDTVLYTDVLGLIVHDKAASGAVNETLPTPTTLTNTAFAYTYCNNSAQTDTITPTTWTIAVNGGTAGASVSVATGVCAQISVDPFNATQWDAFTIGAPSSPVSAQTSGTTFTPVCVAGEATTVNTIVATGNLTINLPTGCADGQGVKLRIKFTASITYTFNAGYHAGTTTGITALPTASSSASGEDYLQFDDDTANSRFNYLAIASF